MQPERDGEPQISVQQASRKLREDAARLVGGLELSTGAFEELRNALNVLIEKATSADPTGTLSVVCGPSNIALPLAQLISHAVRTEIAVDRSSEPYQRHLHCAGARAVELAALICKAAVKAPAGSPAVAAASALASTLLRTQTLQAAARQAASFAGALAPGGAWPSRATVASPAAMQAWTLSMGARHHALMVAAAVLRLVAGIAMLAHKHKDKAVNAALVAALRQSRLMDHMGRLLLLVSPPPGLWPPWDPLDCTYRHALISLFGAANQMSRPVDPDGGLARADHAGMLFPGACNAPLTLSAAALAAADGGPCGLPRSPLLTSPTFRSARYSYPCLDGWVLQWLITLLVFDADTALPHLTSVCSPRATIRLLLRVLRLAAASIRAAGGHVVQAPDGKLQVDMGWAGGRRAEVQEYKLLLTPEDARILPVPTLIGLQMVAERAPKAWTAEAERSLAPLLSAVRSCLEGASVEDQEDEDLPCHLLCLLGDAAKARPAGPDEPYVSLQSLRWPLVRSGLVPMLETLLRCGGKDPSGPEALLAGTLVSFRGKGASAVNLLILDSPPRQAAAFMSTLAKLLRRTPPQALLEPKDRGSPGLQYAALLLQYSLSIADGVDFWTEPPAPVDPAEPCAPIFVIALAVVKLLPELARLVREAAQLVAAGGVPHGRDAWHLHKGIEVVLRALEAAVRSASRPTGSTPAAAPRGRLDAALSLPFLVWEAGAVPLLGALLTLLESGGGDTGEAADGEELCIQPDLLSCLGEACLGLHRSYPHLVFPAGRAACWGGSSGDVAAGGFGALGWRPAALWRLASLLEGTHTALSRGLLSLADQLEQAPAAGGAPGVSASPWHAKLTRQAEALAALRAEVRGLLPACGNPACVSLAGDSEAGLRLQACGRCVACRPAAAGGARLRTGGRGRGRRALRN